MKEESLKKLIKNKQEAYLEKNIIMDVKNLSVSIYNNHNKLSTPIIKNLDFRIKKSEIIGIVGESGSGKSMTFKAILNLDKNYQTSVEKAFLNNVEIPKFNNKKNWKQIWGKQIIYIPQESAINLNPTRKIKNIFLDILKQNNLGLKTKLEKIEYIKKWLKVIELENVEKILNSYPSSLSGGQRQRICIALALAKKPNIIVADEPTSALDSSTQNSILNLLKKINSKYEISVVFISHNLSAIAKICDYVYVLKDGIFIEKGITEEIFLYPAHPYTYNLISLASDVCLQQKNETNSQLSDGIKKLNYSKVANSSNWSTNKNQNNFELKKISQTHYVLDCFECWKKDNKYFPSKFKKYLELFESSYNEK